MGQCTKVSGLMEKRTAKAYLYNKMAQLMRANSSIITNRVLEFLSIQTVISSREAGLKISDKELVFSDKPMGQHMKAIGQMTSKRVSERQTGKMDQIIRDTTRLVIGMDKALIDMPMDQSMKETFKTTMLTVMEFSLM